MAHLVGRVPSRLSSNEAPGFESILGPLLHVTPSLCTVSEGSRAEPKTIFIDVSYEQTQAVENILRVAERMTYLGIVPKVGPLFHFLLCLP